MDQSQHAGLDPDEGPSETEQSLPARFEQQAILHCSRPALGSGDWQPTYAELNHAADHLARHLLSRTGDSTGRNALLMRHDTPLVAAVLAVLKAGRTVVVLNPTDPAPRLRQILADADASLILTDLANREVALQLREQSRGVVCCEELFTGKPAPDLQVPVSPDDVAFLIYTSGSTGCPKGVMQTHRNILHNVLRLTRGMGLHSEDRVVLLTSLSGGQGVATLWCSLLNGAALYPFPIMEKGTSGLANLLRDHGINVFASSASVFRHFMKSLEDGERFPLVRLVRLGGEPVTSHDFAAFQRHFDDGCTLLQTFSSTESGNLTQLRLSRTESVAAGRLPIGRPAPGIELLLLDEHGREVSEGQTGEIVVRSRYLSPGYWRNPTLTGERFSGADRATEVRIFRSGDVGRRTSDGLLVFEGRKDTRIKIRGYRIEPFEVEDALLLQPGVEQAVVCACARQEDDAQLIAYVRLQAGHKPKAEELRSALLARLPSHMVPTGFVFLDTFPLTAHGKIDHEKLRRIRPSPPTRESAQGPMTETELLLGGIWAKILGHDSIGRQDDFFALGGDSLTAAVVTGKVYAALGVELDLGAFAKHPTLSALAAVIENLQRAPGANGLPRLLPVPRNRSLPLSFEQERTWKYSRTPETSARYNVACSHQIKGPLDVEALRASINTITRRHGILRTSFAEVDGQPVQIVHLPVPVPVPLIDLAQASDAAEQATRFLRSEARRPFDLASLPLLRWWLVRIREDVHWLLRVYHHIIADGWSWNVFFRELGLLYEATLRGEEPPLPEFEPLQYGDYAVWQRRALSPEGHAYQSALAWWKSLFSDEPPPLELPFRRPEPLPEADPSEGLIWWGLAPETSKRLENVRRGEGATFYVIRLAAFVAVLARETGQPDVVVGTYVTKRNRVEIQDMFGFFSDLATLRLRCDFTRTFHEWVSEVRQTVGETQSHCEIPYEQLCQDMRIHGLNPPEIRAIFGVSDHTAAVTFGGLEMTWLDRRMETMPWGFSLTFDQHNEQHRCRVDFDARIYDPEGVRALIEGFLRFLDAASSHPDQKLIHLLEMSETPETLSNTGANSDRP